MLDYATALRASNSTFTDQVRRMDRAVDAAMDKWQGEAAAAASARSLSESLAASHIDTAVTAVAEAHASHGPYSTASVPRCWPSWTSRHPVSACRCPTTAP